MEVYYELGCQVKVVENRRKRIKITSMFWKSWA